MFRRRNFIRSMMLAHVVFYEMPETVNPVVVAFPGRSTDGFRFRQFEERESNCPPLSQGDNC